MGRTNKHGLPPGLRWTERDGYLIDLWFMKQDGKRGRIRERLGHIPVTLAKSLLAKRRGEMVDNKLGRGTVEQVTIREAFDRYLEWAATERPRSMKFRRTAAGRVGAAIGKRLLRELTPWMLERYKADQKKAGLSDATINLDLAAVKHMLGRAVVWGWITREKALEIRDEVKLYTLHNERVRFLSPEEKARLLKACPDDLREIVSGALNLGARAGELMLLQWSAVDLKRGTVVITRYKGKKPVHDRIMMNPDLIASLKVAKARAAGPYVFTTAHERRWRKSWLHESFAAATDAAGLVDFHFHDLRHHFASTLVQRGIGLQRVQALLGHARITTTARYAHLAPEADNATLALMDKPVAIRRVRRKAKPSKKR